MRFEFTGSKDQVKAVEDCICATGHKTRVLSPFRQLSDLMQGGDIPSMVKTIEYEVLPDMDIDEQLPIGQAIENALDFLWGETPHYRVHFLYDSRPGSKSKVTIKGGKDAVVNLCRGIPRFKEAMLNVVSCRSAAVK